MNIISNAAMNIVDKPQCPSSIKYIYIGNIIGRHSVGLESVGVVGCRITEWLLA